MSYFSDNICNHYYLSDPFGFTCNSINGPFRNSISFQPNYQQYQNNYNTNEDKAKKAKTRRKSFDGFFHSFSFLNRIRDTDNNNIHNNNNNNNNKIKEKNNKNLLKSYSRTYSSPTKLGDAPINNINDKADRIELKKYGCKYSDLLDNQIYQPKLDVEEESTHYFIRIHLPDVRKEEINLEIFENNIIIHGERIRKINKYATFTKFNRTFTIPDDTNADELKVAFENDVLELTFKKINE